MPLASPPAGIEKKHDAGGWQVVTRDRRSPQRVRDESSGRSPGSQVLTHRLPTRWNRAVAAMAWVATLGAPALAYRCGGSTGIVAESSAHTCFPFHPAAWRRPGHLTLYPALFGAGSGLYPSVPDSIDRGLHYLL